MSELKHEAVSDLTFPQLIEALNSERRSEAIYYLIAEVLDDSLLPFTDRKYDRYQHERIAEEVSQTLIRIVQNWQGVGGYELIDARAAILILQCSPTFSGIIRRALNEAAKVKELESAAMEAQVARNIRERYECAEVELAIIRTKRKLEQTTRLAQESGQV